MPFRIHALPAEDFAPLFMLSDDALAKLKARRMIVEEGMGVPCRVSIADAKLGETVILLNYRHQPAETPFQSTHAIFVRQGVAQAHPAVGEVPAALRARLISLRLFGADDMMIDADVVDGEKLGDAIEDALRNDAVSYAHLHFAKPGCFAASVTRAR